MSVPIVGTASPEQAFPVIEHIGDVLPHIEGREEFRVFERDACKVVRYMVADLETFGYDEDLGLHNMLIRRECRGLVFDDSGRLVARPYHKFFNVGEREETDLSVIDLSVEHSVLDKLDGSMVFPVVLGGALRLHTKSGITDTAMRAEVFLAARPRYVEFMLELDREGRTPIFEWCSRQDPIVVDYPVDEMVLTAIREKHTGRYIGARTLCSVAAHWEIPVVGSRESVHPTQKHSLISRVRAQPEGEGVVVRFSNGEMLKIKADDYVLKHGVIGRFSTRRSHTKAILGDLLDDILPLLPPFRRDDLLRYQVELDRGIASWRAHAIRVMNEIVREVEPSKDPAEQRKRFAQAIKREDRRIHHLLFAMLDGGEPGDLLREQLLQACARSATLRKYDWIIEGCS
jgi:RNA ligase